MKTRNIVSVLFGLVAGLSAQVGWGECGGFSGTGTFAAVFDKITHVAVDTYSVLGAPTTNHSALQIEGTETVGGQIGRMYLRNESSDNLISNEHQTSSLLECAKSARMVMLAPDRFDLFVWVVNGRQYSQDPFPGSCFTLNINSYCALVLQSPAGR